MRLLNLDFITAFGLAALAPFSFAREVTASAMRLPEFAGAAHGFPVMLDPQGRKLADGEFQQRIENGRLHVTLKYDFGASHHVEEDTIFQQEPALAQQEWRWRESKNNEI